MSDITIILVTFNSAKIIKQSLERLNADKYDIVVVDNASSDDTCQIIATNFPKVKLIKDSQNIGYGRANNIALRDAKTEFALLLNVDALIEDETIDKIINLLKNNPQIAISSPIVYGAKLVDGKYVEGNRVLGLKKKKYVSEDENFYYNQFVTGAAMFLNMKVMPQVGLFDEGFFLYCEDNEICKRAIKKGYKTAIVKNTKFYHLNGGSSEISSTFSAKICWHKFGWSKLYYTQKIWGRPVAMVKSIRMILKFSLMILKDLIKTHQVGVINKAGMKGCFMYLVGFGAFDKNDNPRG